jgi:hypothetical protein
MTVAIPEWNAEGVLPPTGEDPVSPERSPYPVSLLQLVDRFATTTERWTILNGFLRYRAALHACGLVVGTQWIDGSFVEDIEATANRPPNDVDVVTFVLMPDGLTERDIGMRNPDLFVHDAVKQTYHVDAFPVGIRGTLDQLLQQATYWYGLWSHTRTKQWKGYLAVDLAPTEDAGALSLLANMGELVNP